MKRRDFFHYAAGGTFSLGVSSLSNSGSLPKAMGADEKMSQPWEAVHNSDLYQAVIALPGLSESFKVMHITDSHISRELPEDEEFLTLYGKRMTDAYSSARHYKTGQSGVPLLFFEQILDIAKQQKVDRLLLTGDIVNNPAIGSVRAVLERLEATKIPFLYTAGNHDWHYEGMEGTSESLRETWTEKRLKLLYAGADPMCSSNIHKGVNFVRINDSTYQISERQLEFYRQQKSKPEPIALMMHIPLFMPTMGIATCGHPDWGEKTDGNYKIERRPIWPQEGCSATTKQFVREVCSTPQLAGIFTGHLHQAFTVSKGDSIQHVAAFAASGAYRIVQFQPYG